MTDTRPSGRQTDESSDRHQSHEATDRQHTDEANQSTRSGSGATDRVGELSEADEQGGEESDDATARRIRSLYWVGLGGCALLALVALFRFYASIEAAIGVWIATEYQPIASGAFNFAVLLVALVGVSVTIRRLTH